LDGQDVERQGKMIETAVTLKVHIGETGIYQVNGLAFSVRVIDVRSRWGIIDYLIVPESGKGSQWVVSGKVSFAK
jgi:hypothetical protein